MCNCNVCASGCPNFPAAPKATPHKHAAVIKAWAEGAVIECRASIADEWVTVPYPTWAEWCGYRVKAVKKTPGHLLWIAMGYGSASYKPPIDGLWEERACQFLDAVKGQA